MRLVDKLSACMYVFVGLARLYGTDNTSRLTDRAFGLIVLGIAVLSIVSFRVSLLDALPSTFFLVMHTLAVLKAYSQTEGVTKRDAILWIVGTVAVSIVLFTSLSHYEESHPDIVTSLMSDVADGTGRVETE